MALDPVSELYNAPDPLAGFHGLDASKKKTKLRLSDMQHI